MQAWLGDPTRSRRYATRSSSVGPARGWSSGGSGSRGTRSLGSPTRNTGVARCPGSATLERGCWCSGWRPPRTGEPDRPDLHRRPLGRLPLFVHAPHGVREPADVGRSRRRARAARRVHRRGEPLRPAANRPTPGERDRCLPFLEREIIALEDLRVVVALGAFAWNGALHALAALGHAGRPRPASATGLRLGSARSRSSAASTRASRTPSPAGSRHRCSTRCSSERATWPPGTIAARPAPVSGSSARAARRASGASDRGTVSPRRRASP